MPGRIIGTRLSSEHHGYIHPSGQLGQPLGMARKRKAGEMEGVLMRGGGNDRVDLATERETSGSLDGVTRYSAGSDDPVAITISVSAAQPPAAHGDAVLGGNALDLIFSPDQGDICVNGPSECSSRDLRTDAARVSQRHR
jgi:hypothetical protein